MPILSEKWHILTWSHIGPKFNFHHLQEIFTDLKIAVLTPKLGIPLELDTPIYTMGYSYHTF